MPRDFKNSDPVDVLGNIPQVDLPPFLFTRILSKLGDPAFQPARPRFVVIWSFALALLIGVNILVLGQRQKENQIPQNEFGLSTNYSLYYND